MTDIVFYFPLGFKGMTAAKQVLSANLQNFQFHSHVGDKEYTIEQYMFGSTVEEERSLRFGKEQKIPFNTIKISISRADLIIPRIGNGIDCPELTSRIHQQLRDAIEALNYLLLAIRRFKLSQDSWRNGPVIDRTFASCQVA